jgi:tight adherence protein C
MIGFTVALTFVVTVLVLGSLGFAFSAGNKGIAGRLEERWRPRQPVTGARAGDKQKEQLGRALSSLGKLIPASRQGASRTQRMMTRAGFRRPEAARALVGAKIALSAGLLSLTYFSGLYRLSQASLLFAGVLGYLLPDLWLHRRIRLRQHRIRMGLADTLDLLVICVEAGLGLDQAMLRVSQELKIAHPDLSQELEWVNLEMRVGKARMDALRALAARTGVDDIKSLVATLIQTDRFGTSVAQSLRVHAETLRTKRRQRAEEQAAKTPVKMVPILVFFIFPALFVVILGPAFINLSRQILPMLSR